MKCRITDFSFSFNGKQRLTIELEEDFRSKYDGLKDKDLNLELKQWREKRTLTANAYAWCLIDKIAAKRRMSKVEVYRNAIRDIGGVSNLVCIQNRAVEELKTTWSAFGIGWQAEELDSNIPGWTNVLLYKGSSVYDREQMAALIDSLVQDAKSIGIETKPQEDIDSLLQEVEQSVKPRSNSGAAHERP